MLDISNKDFKTGLVITLQEIGTNALEANGNIENIAIKYKS